jgi:hypothetical protein
MNDDEKAERICAALAALRAEGLEVELRPDAVFVKIGTLEVASPYTPGTMRRPTTTVMLDGHRIECRLEGLTITLKVGEVNRASLMVVP